MMKNLKVKIQAYGHSAEVVIHALDSAEGVENAILDKIGQNEIKFTPDGFLHKKLCYITYEEVANEPQSHQGPIHEKKVVGA